jgi:Taurine catabolism dioxygenase TauD, TfdA family
MASIEAQATHASAVEKSSTVEDAPLTFKETPYLPSVHLAEPYPPNTSFPLSLSPEKPNSSISDLTAAIRTASANGVVRDLLTQHGAIYFQNLNLKDAQEFSEFASAFGWAPHEDIGNPVRRTLHAYNVATANEGPNTQPVYPHNEFGLSPHYPAYVFFWCMSEPETGEYSSLGSSPLR